jgi:hypothetical protein
MREAETRQGKERASPQIPTQYAAKASPQTATSRHGEARGIRDKTPVVGEARQLLGLVPPAMERCL